jgi:hypothetical protein
MNKDKYFTKDIDNNWVEVDEEIAKDVLRQYFERRYIGVFVLSAFIVGFLLGVIAS